jgi:hypothetical protein
LHSLRVVRLDVVPSVSDTELAVIELALSRSGTTLDPTPAAQRARWSRAAAREAVEATPSLPARYACSPRSTRGATRA